MAGFVGMITRILVRTSASNDDAGLACLARRLRDIPSTLGYFHATPRRHTEKNERASITRGQR